MLASGIMRSPAGPMQAMAALLPNFSVSRSKVSQVSLPQTASAGTSEIYARANLNGVFADEFHLVCPSLRHDHVHVVDNKRIEGYPCSRRNAHSGTGAPLGESTFGWISFIRSPLARIILENEDAEAPFCYKHGVKSVFEARRKASACLTIAQHSVCCSPRFSPSPPCCSLIN